MKGSIIISAMFFFTVQPVLATTWVGADGTTAGADTVYDAIYESSTDVFNYVRPDELSTSLSGDTQAVLWVDSTSGESTSTLNLSVMSSSAETDTVTLGSEESMHITSLENTDRYVVGGWYSRHSTGDEEAEVFVYQLGTLDSDTLVGSTTYENIRGVETKIIDGNIVANWSVDNSEDTAYQTLYFSSYDQTTGEWTSTLLTSTNLVSSRFKTIGDSTGFYYVIGTSELHYYHTMDGVTWVDATMVDSSTVGTDQIELINEEELYVNAESDNTAFQFFGLGSGSTYDVYVTVADLSDVSVWEVERLSPASSNGGLEGRIRANQEGNDFGIAWAEKDGSGAKDVYVSTFDGDSGDLTDWTTRSVESITTASSDTLELADFQFNTSGEPSVVYALGQENSHGRIEDNNTYFAEYSGGAWNSSLVKHDPDRLTFMADALYLSDTKMGILFRGAQANNTGITEPGIQLYSKLTTDTTWTKTVYSTTATLYGGPNWPAVKIFNSYGRAFWLGSAAQRMFTRGINAMTNKSASVCNAGEFSGGTGWNSLEITSDDTFRFFAECGDDAGGNSTTNSFVSIKFNTSTKWSNKKFMANDAYTGSQMATLIITYDENSLYHTIASYVDETTNTTALLFTQER